MCENGPMVEQDIEGSCISDSSYLIHLSATTLKPATCLNVAPVTAPLLFLISAAQSRFNLHPAEINNPNNRLRNSQVSLICLDKSTSPPLHNLMLFSGEERWLCLGPEWMWPRLNHTHKKRSQLIGDDVVCGGDFGCLITTFWSL